MPFHVDLVAQKNDLEKFFLVGTLAPRRQFTYALEVFANFDKTLLVRDAVDQYEQVGPFEILFEIATILDNAFVFKILYN